ncbi:MAG: hypothetical protein NTV36_03360 [Candidatus Staskawiczbacteria bacterium]|nr:hypothetical protein [Candidatus Staskawiczbacteria bacterium]
MNKKTLFLVLLSILVMPSLVFAQGLTCEGGVTIPNMVCNATNVALAVASGVVIILWLATGLLFLTAQGDPAKLNKGKLALFTSIAGTVLVIAAYWGMDLVGSIFGI